jgi:hypothetical protein
VSAEGFEGARRYLNTEGRLLERRLFESLFEGADPQGVVDAVRAYRNPDGGFGHGLEPDKQTPTSQPLDVEVAFHALDAVGGAEGGLVRGACDFLLPLGGGVACLTGSVDDFPHAPHWSGFAARPSLNPTAGIVALLWKWDFEHPWRDGATQFCWAALAGGLPTDAHTFGEVLAFLEHVPHRDQADRVVAALGGALVRLALFHLEPVGNGYGLTPLHFAPSPTSRWAKLFSNQILEGHLDLLASAQAADGGWPLSWEPPGVAATCAWRGIETLRALRTLRAYGRL